MRFPDVIFRLPDWVDGLLPGSDRVWASAEQRMGLAIELARLNVEHRTGGPFGAAVFEIDSGRLIAPGVNLVVGSACSAAHAEIVALSIAQKVVGRYDLGAPGGPSCELVCSSEPCAMCLGAIPWSGVSRLVCGARDQDAWAIGFDEGAKPANWIRTLTDRGIDVVRDVLRSQAVAVLQQYAKAGGPIYGGGQARDSRHRTGD